MKLRNYFRSAALVAICLGLLALTGCLYPDDQSPGSEVSARESVLTVQDAVDRFFAQTDVLPIQNADQSVPMYEKYKVDFGKLKRMQFMANIPKMAFENGGSYQFLIIDEETKPVVKLLDLVVYQTVAGVQKKVDQYRSNNGNRNPAGDEAYPGFANIDFGKLGSASPDVRSMYSRQPLNLLVDEQGQVFVDYGIDIVTAIAKSDNPPQENVDLRRSLIEASYFVPVKSPVYQLVSGEPQAVKE